MYLLEILLHGLSMFAVMAKIYGERYNQSSSIAFDETSSYWSAPKSPNFLAFHWSPRLPGFHWSAFRNQESSTSTEKEQNRLNYQSGSNHQLLQLYKACTAWSDSDQAVLVVHSCNSWLLFKFGQKYCQDHE